MGIYSNSRVPGVMNESSTSTNEEFTLTPNPNAGTLLEACILLQENDAQMFDSLLELDFLAAANNSLVTEAEAEAANEAKKNSIKEKMGQIIDSIIRKFNEIASNVIVKITELFKNDEKLINAYKKDLNIANLKGFKGIPNFAMPKDAKTIFASGAYKSAVETNFNNYKVKIEAANDRDAVSSVIEEFKSTMRDNKALDAMINDAFEEKVEYFVPNNEQLNTIITYVSGAGKQGIDGIKNTFKGSKDFLTKTKQGLKSGSKKGDEIEVIRLNGLRELVSLMLQDYTKEYRARLQIAVKALSAYRKAYIICGRYALKTAKGEDAVDVEESATNFVLAEANDIFINEQFECLL